MTLGEAEIVLEAGSETESADIMRCLRALYGSREGEQALDRGFGISWDAVDKPVEAAKALLTAEFVRKTARYEPRVRVSRVEWEDSALANGVLVPKVVIRLV